MSRLGKEEHGLHRLERMYPRVSHLAASNESLRASIGRWSGGSGSGGDAVEVAVDHDGDVFHRLDLGTQNVGAPLLQHDGYDVNLLVIEDVRQFACDRAIRARCVWW